MEQGWDACNIIIFPTIFGEILKESEAVIPILSSSSDPAFSILLLLHIHT